MFGLAKVNAAEVAIGENHAFGPQPVEILVAKVMRSEFALAPDSLGLGHAISRAPKGAR
jgi:hypothetical protein